MISEFEFIARSSRALAQRAAERPLVRAVILGLCAWPLIALLQQLLLLSAGALVSSLLANGAPNPGVADEVYWRLAISMIASARPAGLAVGMPFGAAFAPGASIVGVQLIQLVVNTLLIAAGVALLAVSLARPQRQVLRRVLCSPEARIASAVMIGMGVAAQFQVQWASEGSDMALSMVATKLLGLNSRTYESALRWGTGVSAGLNVLVIVAAATSSAVLTLAALRLLAGHVTLARLARAVRAPVFWRATGAVALLVVALAPLQGRPVLQEAYSPAVAERQSTDGGSEEAAWLDQTAVDATEPSKANSGIELPHAPTVVSISGQGDKFQYHVNGRPDFIRGIGYNPMTQRLTNEQRAARYNRDFGEMAALGVNTVVGWDEAEFDDLLMDRATAHGVGVILPFDLKPTWNYADPDVRWRLRLAISDRVMHFRNSPSLHMWGLGNEVLHDMAKLRTPPTTAFAEFEVEMADLIHKMDPDHPVVYRDAEDVYMRPIAAALRETDAVRPWFVYGMNFFTGRLDDALNKGAVRGLHQPLLISEFGPVGLRPADRPAGYARLWNIIRAHSDSLLGGCAYVWSTAGPEPLDRTFGLTNEAGVPVDGSTSALASLYTSDQAKELAAAAPKQ